jgi:hypothetical protein
MPVDITVSTASSSRSSSNAGVVYLMVRSPVCLFDKIRKAKKIYKVVEPDAKHLFIDPWGLDPNGFWMSGRRKSISPFPSSFSAPEQSIIVLESTELGRVKAPLPVCSP